MSASINKAIVIGNLTRDPESRFLDGGSQVCSLSVATNRKWKNKQTGEYQEETEFHNITVWGKQAEHCANYLRKGRKVYIEGRLKTDSYEKDGVKKYSTKIVADTVQFLGGKETSKPASNAGAGDIGGWADDKIPF